MPGRPDLSKRSYDKELLDRDDIPFPDIERNMRELDIINTWLGGHAISVRGLRSFLDGWRGGPAAWAGASAEGGVKRLHLCEIGCGGGDNLRVLSRYCRERGIAVQVTGIDSNAHCIAVAQERWTEGNARWVHSDYRQVVFENGKPDILFSSLFCHHFTDEELVFMLRWMRENSGRGWFINDLQRHPLAYHSIRLLTRWLSHSYLVKNDAPLSVLRGFTRREWENLLAQSGIGPYSLRWKWAFRWLVCSGNREGTTDQYV